MGEYDFREIRGHIQVYLDGEFLFSADTMREAIEEIEEEKKSSLLASANMGA